jgi:hypothetical protein
MTVDFLRGVSDKVRLNADQNKYLYFLLINGHEYRIYVESYYICISVTCMASLDLPHKFRKKGSDMKRPFEFLCRTSELFSSPDKFNGILMHTGLGFFFLRGARYFCHTVT